MKLVVQINSIVVSSTVPNSFDVAATAYDDALNVASGAIYQLPLNYIDDVGAAKAEIVQQMIGYFNSAFPLSPYTTGQIIAVGFELLDGPREVKFTLG